MPSSADDLRAMLEDERARALAELHEVLDVLESERTRRIEAEATIAAIESSRLWRARRRLRALFRLPDLGGRE